MKPVMSRAQVTVIYRFPVVGINPLFIYTIHFVKEGIVVRIDEIGTSITDSDISLIVIKDQCPSLIKILFQYGFECQRVLRTVVYQ